MRESKFESLTVEEIRAAFPGAIILKNDANYLQGVPDRLVLWGRHWAALEFKGSASSRTQPNQAYYVEQMREMGYASFIYPSNKDDVISELQFAFRPCR